MTGLPDNVDDILARLADTSKREVDLVKRLSEAVRRADEQVLREVRNVTLQHEVRREAIFSELQNLALRLCAFPARGVLSASAVIDQAGQEQAAIANGQANGGGDWRQAAQKIDEELEFTFNGQVPRH